MDLASAINIYVDNFTLIFELAKKYERPTESIEEKIAKVKDFKVTLPIVGAFSSGKSTLINELLGEKILPVDVDPITAVPTEIYYSTIENISACQGDTSQKVTRQELRSNPFGSDTVEVLRVGINNPWLESIHGVKIVDLPGLESNDSTHEKAIDNYLPLSMAYIITISAEDGTVRNSVLEFIKELNLLDMDVLVAITKGDKKDVNKEGIFEEVSNRINSALSAKNVEICIISSRNKDVGAVKKYLANIQKNAVNILNRYNYEKLREEVTNLHNYLTIRLDNENSSLSNIEQEEIKIKNEMNEALANMEKERVHFNRQIDSFIQKMQDRIGSNLNGMADILVQDIMNNIDVQFKIQQALRTTITEGIKTEFEPKLQRYLKKIQEVIPKDFSINTQVNVDPMQVKMDDMMKQTVLKVIPVIITAIGGTLAGPFGAVIAGGISILVEMFFNERGQERKREAVRHKLQNEVIPSIIQKAVEELSISLQKSIEKLNQEIEKSLANQQEACLEALEKLRQQKEMESEKLEILKVQIKRDIETLSASLQKIELGQSA